MAEEDRLGLVVVRGPEPRPNSTTSLLYDASKGDTVCGIGGNWASPFPISLVRVFFCLALRSPLPWRLGSRVWWRNRLHHWHPQCRCPLLSRYPHAPPVALGLYLVRAWFVPPLPLCIDCGLGQGSHMLLIC
jgi:hypothetical protein